MTRLIILFLSLILLQCQSSLKEQDTDITICQTGSGEIIAEPSTVAMIERVKEAVSKIDVLNVPYILNSKKAALILEQIPSAAGMQKTSCFLITEMN
jgi:hypothetical protein